MGFHGDWGSERSRAVNMFSRTRRNNKLRIGSKYHIASNTACGHVKKHNAGPSFTLFLQDDLEAHMISRSLVHGPARPPAPRAFHLVPKGETRFSVC